MSLFNGKEFFFRTADRELCDGLCERIAREGMSLAIIGSSSAAIEHYGRVVVNRLQAMTDPRFDVTVATSTEGLLDRFNEILRSMSMAQAMGERDQAQPVRILVSGNADALDVKEGRLLARLVDNFPGAGTQLVLLHEDQGSEGAEEPLEHFGKRLVRWYVRPPSRPEAMDLLLGAGEAGVEQEVMQVLNRINPLFVEEQPPSPARQEPAPAVQDDAPPAAQAKKNEPREPVMREVAPEPVPADAPRLYAGDAPLAAGKRGRRRTPWAAMTLALLVASTVVAAFVFPERRDALVDLFRAPSTVPATPIASIKTAPLIEETVIDEWPASAPVATAPVAAKVPEKSVSAPKIDEKTVVKPAVAVGTTAAVEAETATPASKPAVARLESVVTKPAAPVKTNAPAAKEPPAKEAPKAAAKTKAPAAEKPATKTAAGQATTPKPPAAVQSAIAKVRATPGDHYFVQSVALDSFELASAWRKARPPLAKALIVPIRVGERSDLKYVVLSGPFRNRAAASEFAKSNDMPADRWVRQASTLKTALPPDTGEPRTKKAR